MDDQTVANEEQSLTAIPDAGVGCAYTEVALRRKCVGGGPMPRLTLQQREGVGVQLQQTQGGLRLFREEMYRQGGLYNSPRPPPGVTKWPPFHDVGLCRSLPHDRRMMMSCRRAPGNPEVSLGVDGAQASREACRMPQGLRRVQQYGRRDECRSRSPLHERRRMRMSRCRAPGSPELGQAGRPGAAIWPPGRRLEPRIVPRHRETVEMLQGGSR